MIADLSALALSALVVLGIVWGAPVLTGVAAFALGFLAARRDRQGEST